MESGRNEHLVSVLEITMNQKSIEMKKVVIILSMVFMNLVLFGQSSYSFEEAGPNLVRHAFGDVSIAISPNLIMNNRPYESTFAGGLKIKLYVGKRFSFDSDLVLGHNYLHFGPGILGLPIAYFAGNMDTEGENNSLEEFLFKFVIVILSAEHFAYHIPVNNTLEISPYTSFLRFKELQSVKHSDNLNSSESPVCYAFGLELNKYFKHFVLSPYIDYNIAYSEKIHGLNCGLYFGWYF